MSWQHGTINGYRHKGCHCAECRAANAAKARRDTNRRILRLRDDPTLAPHGVASTYSNWGCRCRDCTQAQARKKANEARRRAVQREEDR